MTNQEIKYAIYARKSSEQDDKQAASIDAQRNEMTQLAEREGIKVKMVLEESHSAKDPGRPVFNHLIELVNRGEINGLLVWHPNRLSRNNFDLATITDLLGRGKLLSIKPRVKPSETAQWSNSFFYWPSDKLS